MADEHWADQLVPAEVEATVVMLRRRLEDVTAERDRLRAVVDDVDLQAARDAVTHLEATIAERDRLRATLDAEREQWLKETRHAASRIGSANRERDRLRAVVDAAATEAIAVAEMDDRLIAAVRGRELGLWLRRQLDGSGDMGDG